jgi:acyl-CoA synthetase
MVHGADEVARYKANGWWGTASLAERIQAHAASMPEATAFVTAPAGAASAEQATSTTWREYDEASTTLARALVATGIDRGERIAVIMPDGPTVHEAFVGVEKAGLITVGIGARAGDREVAHLMQLTGATSLLTLGDVRGRPAGGLREAMEAAGVRVDHHVSVTPATGTQSISVEVDGRPGELAAASDLAGRAMDADELSMLNSTSGTTGLPKCVMHNQNRWFYFHHLAVLAGELNGDDVFMGAVPAPFGFGLWTAHYSPTALGAPAVLMERFDANLALDLIEAHRVSVLGCVSTQFIMLLNAQAERPRDVSSLRAMFTGGEAVPYERAAEFEEATGARVLQFYGSNETGALSRTDTHDTRERRLRTAGRIIDEMEVRMFDPESGDELPAGVPGQPACKGPATCLGYWGDEAANAKLFTSDGWMLMGDIVEIDDEGYLTVVGRVSDFIIRGGKNISAPAVEAEVGTHPDVAMVAAVAMPDPVFGERVCIYVEPRPGAEVTLASIVEHLSSRGVSKEWFPEHLVVMEELPRSSGGKVAKGELKEDAKQRAASR